MSILTTAGAAVAPRRQRRQPAYNLDTAPLPAHLRPEAEAVTAGLAGARTWARELRCRQWSRNLVVLAVPAASGSLGQTFVAGRAALALVIFCLLSSAAYLVNDVFDLTDDRRHPVKRDRPMAAGAITTSEALIAAAGCAGVALISAAMVDVRLLLIALAYAGVSLTYTSWARWVPVVDLVAVSGCLLLQALAGGTAARLPVSSWLLGAVALSGLLVIVARRYAELYDPEIKNGFRVRRGYDPALLRRIGLLACTGAVIAFTGWAAGQSGGTPALRLLSVVPFAVVLGRYGWLAEQAASDGSGRVVTAERTIQLAALLWLMLFLTGA
jgi:decaprenyl-phosphate phosphoribosyltransferase